MTHDADQHTVHRLEAFSDIVIGLSLAQLGATLVIPKHGIDLFTDPTWIFAFLLAFSIICALWFFHHRMFAMIFVPRTVPVLVNFAWLAIVVLCVFATQLFARLPSDEIALRMYFTLFAAAYALLALQYSLCMRLRGGSLGAELAGRARRQRAFMVLWTFPFAISGVVTFLVPLAVAGPFMFLSFTGAVVGSAFLGRYYRRRGVRGTTAALPSER